MTTTGDRGGSAALTGLLAGTGADLLRATVVTRPLPERPPAELLEFLSPVYDAHAHLIDWRLAPHGSDPHATHQPMTSADIAAYRAWRAEFVTERFLGERALVRAFLDWARPRCETRALDVLRLDAAHVDFHTALAMRLQLDHARRILDTGEDHGYGLYTAPGRRVASRTFIPADPPVVLLAAATSVLSVGPSGVSLQLSAESGDPITVTGWTSAAGSVHVRTPGNEVALDEGAAARLLQVAGRHAEFVEVRQEPLSTLLAPLLVFLRDATDLAGDTGCDLHIRSGWG